MIKLTVVDTLKCRALFSTKVATHSKEAPAIRWTSLGSSLFWRSSPTISKVKRAT